MASSIPCIKITLIGDCGVGKTSLVSQLTNPDDQRALTSVYAPTIGCQVQVMRMFDYELRREFFVEIFDVGGNPRFRSTRPLFYDETSGFIFVWDSSMEATYHSLDSWLQEVKQYRANNLKSNPVDFEDLEVNLPLMIVGNKIDKVSQKAKVDLEVACPQHIFASSRARHFESYPFRHFFIEVFRRRWIKDVPHPPQIQALPTLNSQINHIAGLHIYECNESYVRSGKEAESDKDSASGLLSSLLRHRSSERYSAV